MLTSKLECSTTVKLSKWFPLCFCKIRAQDFDGGNMKITAKEKHFVQSLRVARVATVDSDGVPHNVPVCPLFEKNKIYFGTARGARKVRNIEANPSVTVVFDDYTEAWDFLRGVMFQGKGRVVNAKEFREFRKKIYAKYSQYERSAPLGDRDSAIVEVTPERKFSWGIE
jgi:nitroimidazol reductase NimA-like FMN-containing flavoprotein (pyridoxamine 5'-phosphate oxidase superfamily)